MLVFGQLDPQGSRSSFDKSIHLNSLSCCLSVDGLGETGWLLKAILDHVGFDVKVRVHVVAVVLLCSIVPVLLAVLASLLVGLLVAESGVFFVRLLGQGSNGLIQADSNARRVDDLEMLTGSKSYFKQLMPCPFGLTFREFIFS